MFAFRHVLTVVAAVALLHTAGCAVDPHVPTASADPVATPGTTDHAIQIGGLTRTYHLYRPANLAPSAPLVLMLHGGYGTGAQAERSYGWDQQADTAGFLVAYPDGFDRAWNTGGGDCCGIPARRDIDDVAFLTAVVADIERQAPVDASRVYATGISNGGIMSYTLACRTGLFAAIAPDAATQLADCPAPQPISVLHVHGTADPIIPYTGGPGRNIGTVIDGPSAPALNETWRRVDQCADPAVSTDGPVTTSLANCPGGRAVELISIDGAGHQWPGADARPLVQRLLHSDPPATAIDATAVIWQFFAAHGK